MKIEGCRIDSDFWQFEVYAGDKRYDFPVYQNDAVKALALLLSEKDIQDFIRRHDG